jgi:hypothetical protein
MKLKTTLLLVVLTQFIWAQEMTQTIRGKIKDIDSKATLIGASVILISDTTNFTGTVTDVNGNYRIENVSIGRHALQYTYVGYKSTVISNIIVESAKENIINIELEESSTSLGEVEITASKNKGEALNEMALISARSFSVEETDRYAGSRGDPARMASNFAGIGGANDARNDIVIRGNSPMGVLWRLEGIDIPNPNHFAVAGTQGGATSIINNKFLSNSDFFTGAFPAEYGNSLAGVFDLKMRAGNNQKHEISAQFGILGTEVMAEGPLNKEKGSSYLLTYRYSTVTFFRQFGIKIGTDADLWYQDGSFKLNFPTKSGGVFSVFGIGGASDIDILISEQKPDEIDIYGEQDRDQFFGTSMGVLGTSYSKSINSKTFYKVTLAQTTERQKSKHQFIDYKLDTESNYILDENGVYEYNSLVDILGYEFTQHKTILNGHLNSKLNNKHVIKAGISNEFQNVSFVDSLYMFNTTNQWDVRWNAQATAFLIQPYLQWKWKISDKLVTNIGIHNQYYSLNNSYSLLEPRAGLKWEINENQSFKAGIGLHSQTQPTYIYFQQQKDDNGNFVQHNKNIGMSKSMHYVIGYNHLLGKNMRIFTEAYYQNLSNIPTEVNTSSFSLLNQGIGFNRFYPDSLQNSGTGENYGVELTVEKFFSKQFFFMLTTTYYESFYTGSDKVKRDTDFNGNYIFNLLASKEFTTKKKNTFSIGAKVIYAGNKRYGPIDEDASELVQEIVFLDEGRNTKQFTPYFRTDLKLNYKINRIKVSHEISVDLFNLLGTENILKLSYAPNSENSFAEVNQLGFLPIFYYRINI